MKALASLVVLLLVFSPLHVRASDDFSVREAAVFYKGKKVEGSRVTSARSVTDEKNGRVLLWASVDAEETPGFKGAATGLYFFRGTEETESNGKTKSAEGQFAAFMPLEKPEQAFVGFSADGRHFYLSRGTSPFRDLSVHEFAGFKKIRDFRSMPEVFWASDRDGRLVFTLLDEAKGERSPEWGLIAPGWMSVVAYDPKADTVATVAEATETADYMLDAIDNETKLITILEFSVRARADWAIPNVPEDRRREVKFPLQ